MNHQKQDAWQEAKRRCSLSDEEVRMARALGFQPKSLIKNIPAPSQRWKAPVKEWVRSLYEKKIGSPTRALAAEHAPASMPVERPAVIEFRNPDHPWPDKPEIPEPVYDTAETGDELEYIEGFDGYGFRDSFEPPSDEEIDEENGRMLRRQCLFRWAAHSIAIDVSKVPEVQILAAFGAVARPLEMEIPRFREFRRHRIEILHECADLDLAVWMADLQHLKELQRAMKDGLVLVQETPYGGVAHHQVDMHVFEASSGSYRGRLCIFKECPRQGKRECYVPHCGEQPFLQQFAGYRFDPARFEAEPKVILFDRASRFLVRLPQIYAAWRMELSPLRDDDSPY